MKLIKTCILGLLLFPNLSLFAQNNTNLKDSVLWTLEKCLEYAYQNNITLNSLRLNKQSSEQELLLSKAGVLPNLSGSASQSLSHSNTVNNRNSHYTASGIFFGYYPALKASKLDPIEALRYE